MLNLFVEFFALVAHRNLLEPRNRAHPDWSPDAKKGWNGNLFPGPLSIQVGGLRSYNQDRAHCALYPTSTLASAHPEPGPFPVMGQCGRVPGNRAEFLQPCRRDPNQLAKSIEQE